MASAFRSFPSLAVALALIACAVGTDALARSSGLFRDIGRRTQAPGDSTCGAAGCHTAAVPAPPAATLTLLDDATGLPLTEYAAGATYTLRFTIQQASARRWGFQMTALVGASAGGAFPAAINGNYQVAADPGTMRQYVSHTQTGTFAGQAMAASWLIRWVAPMSGDVIFYTCTNSANGTGTSGGDLITCTTFLVPPMAAPVDTDGDGLTDAVEGMLGTSATDADSDDDGRLDGEEVAARTSPIDCDTDGDGLPDGLEAGVAVAHADTNTAALCDAAMSIPSFIPDADSGATTTDPLAADSDSDTCTDSEEDQNRNGVFDPLTAETDPNAMDCPAVATPIMRISNDVTALTGGTGACGLPTVQPLTFVFTTPCDMPRYLGCAPAFALRAGVQEVPFTENATGPDVVLAGVVNPDANPSVLTFYEREGCDQLLFVTKVGADLHCEAQ